MGKIGFLGGTFNPIHNGHLYLAENAYKKLNLDKVIIMPTGLSYLKADDNVLDKQSRADMVKLAIKEYPYFEFSDIELNKDGNTYTFETLQDLKLLYPNDDIYFLVGTDTFFSMDMWKCPDKIFDNCIVAVMLRDDSNFKQIEEKSAEYINKYNAKSVFIDTKKIDISSTEIRNSINSGSYDKKTNMIPDVVYEYIINNRLYL